MKPVKRGVIGRGRATGWYRLRCGHEVTFPSHKGDPPVMLVCKACTEQVTALDNAMR